MLRVVVKLQVDNSDECSVRSSVPAAEQTAHPSAVRAGGHRMISVRRRAHAPFGGEVRVDARPRLLSELAREARPPETVQSQAEHDGCGTFFVTVAFRPPSTNR